MGRIVLIRKLIFIGCFLCSSLAFADKPVTYYAAFEVGLGDISFGNGKGFEGDDIDSPIIGPAMNAGLSIRNRVSLDLTLSTAGSLALFGVDSYSVSQKYLLLGYSFLPSESIVLTPKIGYGRWEVDFNEGALFNPGPEESFDFDEGNDLIFAAELEFKSARRFSGGVKIDYTETDFGSLSNTRLFVKVRLN